MDLVKNIALLLRGLATNAFIVAPYLLIAAALTLVYNPAPRDLVEPGTNLLNAALGKTGLYGSIQNALNGIYQFLPDMIQKALDSWYAGSLGAFSWVVPIGSAYLAFLFGWSLWRSTRSGLLRSEFIGRQASIGAGGLLAVLRIPDLDPLQVGAACRGCAARRDG